MSLNYVFKKKEIRELNIENIIAELRAMPEEMNGLNLRKTGFSRKH